MICVHDFSRGEVSVKVGVMEFGLNWRQDYTEDNNSFRFQSIHFPSRRAIFTLLKLLQTSSECFFSVAIPVERYFAVSFISAACRSRFALFLCCCQRPQLNQIRLCLLNIRSPYIIFRFHSTAHKPGSVVLHQMKPNELSNLSTP